MKITSRQILIDTFVNAVFVYDNKLLLTFNFKDGTRTGAKIENGREILLVGESMDTNRQYACWYPSFYV